jgi:RNA polymerase sigma factor (sigma-70 family)
MPNTSDAAHQIFEDHRPQLTGLAYRMLGSASEAEDLVQDTYLAWHRADRALIDAPGKWLRTVCSRRAIDRLRERKKSKVDYIGDWLPEPVESDPDLGTMVSATPEAQLALSQSITYAFLVVLDQLAPKERAAFLLRDVFALDYAETAACIGVTEQTCRKLVSRGRANLSLGQKEKDFDFMPSRAKQKGMIDAFEQAITTGNTDPLAKLLRADIGLTADSGGKVAAIRRTLTGTSDVLSFISRILSPAWSDMTLQRIETNCGVSIACRLGRTLTGLVSFAFDSRGMTSAIYIMRNPDKLSRLQAILDRTN